MKNRIKQLLDEMRSLNIEAMLIGSEANRRYMSGFTGSSALLYISQKKQMLITDFRYMEQATKECVGYEIINQSQLGLIKTALKLAKEDAIKVIGFESAHTSYDTFLELSEEKDFNYVPTKNIIESFRQVKDQQEIETLAKAESIGDMAFSHVISFIKENHRQGITENDIALEIERVMRKNGASGTSFDTIVASGAKSSLPHAQPDNKILEEGDFVVMDFGCVYKGYCSDMTRTIVIGEPTAKHKEIYETVLKAQRAALEAIKPGMLGKEVDEIARKIITQAGYGGQFGHGLGHSTGLEIHENPRFSPLEKEMIKEGMVITVEPGIYIPEFGGVRIEDLVVVTNDGICNLTHSPKELIIVR